MKVGNYVQASWNSPRRLHREPDAAGAGRSAGGRLGPAAAGGQADAGAVRGGALPRRARSVTKAGQSSGSARGSKRQAKPPLLLRDYATVRPGVRGRLPVGVRRQHRSTSPPRSRPRNDRKSSLDDLAKKHGLDAAFLKRWIEVLAVEPLMKGSDAKSTSGGRPGTALEEKTPANDDAARDQRLAEEGHRPAGAGDQLLRQGRSRFPVACRRTASASTRCRRSSSRSSGRVPIAGEVQVTATIAHAHPACGNGVAWWLEHRRGDRAAMSRGRGCRSRQGGEAAGDRRFKVEKGDVIVLAVDARDGNHVCDMTEIAFTITETDKPGRVWDLAADIADERSRRQPARRQARQRGHLELRSRAVARPLGEERSARIPPDSVLGRGVQAACRPEAARPRRRKLAEQVQTLLSGPRPAKEKSPDRVLYDKLVAVDSPLFAGVDVAKLGKRERRPRSDCRRSSSPTRTSSHAANAVTEVQAAGGAVRRPRVRRRCEARRRRRRPPRARPRRDHHAGPETRWDGPLLGSANGAAYKQLVAGHAEFRKVFPLFICFPQVVPTDEVVTLKMFHREDEPLVRLFLNDEQTRKLDRLWAEHRFVSRQPVAEYDYLPQFMGYTTQDTPKAFQQFFIDRKPLFKKHADEFLKEEEAAIPKQLDALLEFAAGPTAGRLNEKEKADLLALYKTIREQGRRRTTKRSAACWPACWCRRRSCSASSRHPRARNPARSTIGNSPRA